MQVPESIAMTLPARLLPLAQDVIDDAPDCSFNECLAHGTLAPMEKLRTALIDHPEDSAECLGALSELHDYLALVELSRAA